MRQYTAAKDEKDRHLCVFPEDVQAERTLVERSIRSIAAEFSVPVTVTYSNWLRKLNPEDKIAAQAFNGSEEGKSWLCPRFWEYQDFELDQDYRSEFQNTGSYDLVISIILWSRLGTKISPAVVMPDGNRSQNANDYEMPGLDQLNRTPGFRSCALYRKRSTPTPPSQSKEHRETFFRQWDAVQEFFRPGRNKVRLPRPAVTIRICKISRIWFARTFGIFWPGN
jgi:hypothetical protein